MDTLKLFDRAEAPAGEEITNRQVRVTIAGRRGRFTVVDEVWAIEGRLGVALTGSEPPPAFMVGVLNSGEKYWYRWDGSGYRVIGAGEPGFE